MFRIFLSHSYARARHRGSSFTCFMTCTLLAFLLFFSFIFLYFRCHVEFNPFHLSMSLFSYFVEYIGFLNERWISINHANKQKCHIYRTIKYKCRMDCSHQIWWSGICAEHRIQSLLLVAVWAAVWLLFCYWFFAMLRNWIKPKEIQLILDLTFIEFDFHLKTLTKNKWLL